MSDDYREPSFLARYLPRKVVIPALIAGTLAGTALFALLSTTKPDMQQDVSYEQAKPRKTWAERAYKKSKTYLNNAYVSLLGDDAQSKSAPDLSDKVKNP